jgi:hypothetical protein
MVDLFPLPAESIREGFYSVIAGAIAGGAQEPSWIAVDDGTETWLVEVSALSFFDRARGVVAVSSEAALAKAQFLGIGGAMWLPPASLGAIEAFSAAAAHKVPRMYDAEAIEFSAGERSFHVVTFSNRCFWRAQLGDRDLRDLLAELALSLDVPTVILQWPALVVADRDQDAILKAWEKLTAESERPGPALHVLPNVVAEKEALVEAYSALTAAPMMTRSSSPFSEMPVHELPHGRRVGWWGLDGSVRPGDEGWVSAPVEISPTRCRWQLESNETSGLVAEVLASEEITGLEDVLAVRVPGWASRGLRPGSPAGLLVTRIAEAASRHGLPLWIPNVDQEGLRLVLGLPGNLWVDGSAVPR